LGRGNATELVPVLIGMVGEVRACLARVGAQRGMIGNSSSNQCRAVFMTPEPGFGGEERMGEAGGRRFKLQEGIVALALGLQGVWSLVAATSTLL
jgi:hypothetical protein